MSDSTDSTDSGAGMRHMMRLRELCALLGTSGIASNDLADWSDVLSLDFKSNSEGERTGSVSPPQNKPE